MFNEHIISIVTWFQALEEKYLEEIEKLKRKLKWYAENQEILDKSARQLKKKDDDIHKYKMRIEELQTEVNRGE